jgi:hypothetical protein
MRSVYGDYATTFSDIESFMQHLLIDERFEGSTFLAHNGGAYDMQFITQYLDKNGMLYNTIPRPGSQHKYLSLAITRRGRKNIVFKDTLMFIPGSLKNLGKDFGCSVTKGDFPHLFNIAEYQDYEGAIPPLESEEDYFGLRQKKEQKEVKELQEWYLQQTQTYCTCWQQSCHCSKLPWNLQEQLLYYCWLDVEVLAEIVRKFRDSHLHFADEMDSELPGGWKATNIDPFDFFNSVGSCEDVFSTRSCTR